MSEKCSKCNVYEKAVADLCWPCRYDALMDLFVPLARFWQQSMRLPESLPRAEAFDIAIGVGLCDYDGLKTELWQRIADKLDAIDAPRHAFPDDDIPF